MKSFMIAKSRNIVGANSLTAFVPELWAQEGLIVLEENLTMVPLIHRDFSNIVAKFGETIHTRRPAKLESSRKAINTDVTTSDVSATDVEVKLDQWHHISFIIDDSEASKSFQDLIATYLVPAVQGIARNIDLGLLAQKYQFLENNVGKLGTALDKDILIDLDTKMNELLIPEDTRFCNITSAAKGQILKVDDFTQAHILGDDGSALRTASVGELLGVQYLHSQNNREITSGNTVQTFAVDNIAGYDVGETDIDVDGLSATITAGAWCTIAGDMTPQKIIALTGAPTTAIEISPGLQSAVVNNAAVTVYTPGEVNGALSEDEEGEIVVDEFTVAPQTGQLIDFSADYDLDETYGICQPTPTTTSVWLDRLLADDIANDEAACIGPAGNFSFAWHPHALAIVSRPLQLPPTNTGALSSVQASNGLGIRVTISYDAVKQGVRVTVDLLCGYKVLNADLGVLVYS